MCFRQFSDGFESVKNVLSHVHAHLKLGQNVQKQVIVR